MKNSIVILLSIFFCINTISLLKAQNNIRDSLTLYKRVSNIDSIIPLQSKEDTITNKSDIDTLVSATAKDSVVNDIENKITTFYGKAKINFRDYKIEADVIELNWDKYTIHAFNRKIYSDSSEKPPLPTLTEKNEIYKGAEVIYNFKTKTGVVKYGETNIDNGFYKGEKIKKISDDCYYIANGIYTTCDAEHPHFYFSSPKMKVIPKSVIIASPIYLYIADIPIFAIPFAVLPNKTGRQSGIIPPAYGDDINRGKNLRHLGYFWAINDYSDINFTTDLYMKGGYNISSMIRYNVRYLLNGNINLSYSRQKFNVDSDLQKDWYIKVNHNQKIDPTTQLNIDLNFISNNYFINNSTNFDEILRQNMISNATINKYWEGTNRSVSINFYRDQNLTTGEIIENLPSISFTQSQIYPFKKEGSVNTSWYEDIGFNYNSQLLSRHSKTKTTINETDSYKNKYQNGILHNLSVNFSPKIGHFNLTPSISYNEYWYDKIIERKNFINNNKDSIVTNYKHGFYTARAFNLSLSLGTRFYGIFQPNILTINSIRHTVMPSISYNFKPDFSKSTFGFFDRYKLANGKEVIYSKFEEAIFGGPSSGENQNINFTLSNIFEMKTIVKDSIETENKFQLLNLNASFSYNFAADSMKLSDLNINYRTNIANILDLYANTSYSFYDYDQNGYPINKFLTSKNSLLRLTNIGLNISANFKGEKKQKSKTQKEENNEINDVEKSYYGLYDNSEINFDIPWNLSISYDYNFNKSNPYRTFKTSNLRASLGFSLTEKWRIDFSGYYDLVAKKLLAPQLRIQRDLHCWVMNFSWVPIGKYSMFNFEIRIKAPQLSDIKLIKQGSTRGVFD